MLALVPTQYEEKKFSGERNLLASAIERAIYDLKSPDYLERRSALSWLTSKETHAWSCLWMLEQIDLIPSWGRLIIRVQTLRAEVERRDLEAGMYMGPSHKKGKFKNVFLV